MKKLSFIVVILIGFSTTFFGNMAYAATILVYGDSLSAGYGLQPEEAWPSLLQQRLKTEKLDHYKVVNTSITGETTAGGLARFAKTFARYQPAIVILELGANDGLRGLPLNTMRQNLAHIIEFSLKHQSRVLLVSMQIPPNYGKRYTSEFRHSYPQLAKTHNIPLTGFLLEQLSGHPELMQKDGLHPTADAQPLLLDTVWKSLKPLLQTKR